MGLFFGLSHCQNNVNASIPNKLLLPENFLVLTNMKASLQLTYVIGHCISTVC